jgi:hypothetical protein
MFNKRYALLGWLTWQVGKRKAAQKAKSVSSADEGRRPRKVLIVSALGAAVFFWRRRSDAGATGDAAEAGDAPEAGDVAAPDQ